jgi:hypothetical protein
MNAVSPEIRHLLVESGTELESLLHRHIQYTKPLISKEVRGFVVSGVWILLAAA